MKPNARQPSILVVALLALAALQGRARAETKEIGVDQQVGKRIPLDQLRFTDETGNPIALRDLFDRPVVLTLVYYRCPSICSPLLREVARVADIAQLEPGRDYRLVTISFAPDETSDMARRKKENILATMKSRHVPADAWRFMTGDPANIAKLTDAVGFRYSRSDEGMDYMHPSTVIFLSKDGLIIRYIKGLVFNPAELELAVADARDGRPRAFMERLGQLCFSQEASGHHKLTSINRVVFGSTMFLGMIGLIVVVRRSRRRGRAGQKQDQ